MANIPSIKSFSIGFSLLRGDGGPTTFMRRLRESIKCQHLAKTKYFFNPLTNINIYANAVRNPWRRPYVLRVDGISFDAAVGAKINNQRNKTIFDSMSHADGIIFQTEFGLNLISKLWKPPPNPYTIIPNGVDLSHFSPDGPNMRELLNIPPESLVFVTSAKWRAHKRLDAVVRVFKDFQQAREIKAHLIVLGKLDVIPDTMPERVHMIGHIAPESLPNWYRTGNLFLFFSWLDNCPNSVVEALACRLPVICSNQGGTRELVKHANGGIIADADLPFTFEPVELYKPPIPDPVTLLHAVLHAVDTQHELAYNIDRNAIGIDSISKRYVNFLKEISISRGNKQKTLV